MTRKHYYILFIFVTLALFPQRSSSREELTPAISPFSFLENAGQIIDQNGAQRKDIDFRITSGAVSAFIGKGQIHYQWYRPDTNILPNKKRPGTLAELKNIQGKTAIYRMDMELIGANPSARLIKELRQDYQEQYYLPHCGEKGIAAYSYQKITYKDIYPYIDWVLYIKDDQIEYDFVVHPGGRIADIKMRYRGANKLQINKDGSFTATTPMGTLTEKAPYSFQQDGRIIPSHFMIEDNVISFAVAPYEGTLIIDPKLVWPTYYGGDGLMDMGFFSTCNKNGNVYFNGLTTSLTNIATNGAHQTLLNGTSDIFIAKFNSDGSRIWCTYFGGENDELPGNILCDTLENIYLSGATTSLTAIATPGCHQAMPGGGVDAFLGKFDSNGRLQWSTYYGGDQDEPFSLVSTDGSQVFLTGTTFSTGAIATNGAFQDSLWGSQDGFLVKFNNMGNRIWSTYYGGESADELGSVVFDMDGNIYVAGNTSSLDHIATSGAYQELGYGNDALLIKFDKDGNQVWGTYFGGKENDAAVQGAITCDHAGNVYLAGRTSSLSGISTPGSRQSKHNGGGEDGFLSKFSASGEKIWSTYYGGSNYDELGSVVYRNDGRLLISGLTMSDSAITTKNALQPDFSGGFIMGDIFIAEFDTSGIRHWATYYGGAGDETGSISSSESGDIYISGYTNSASGIATSGSYLDSIPPGIYKAFLAKVCMAVAPSAYSKLGSDSVCAYQIASFRVDPVTDAEAYIWILPPGWQGNSDSNSINVIPDENSGTIGVRAIRCSDTSNTIFYDVHVLEEDKPIITVDGLILGTHKTYTQYQWLRNDTAIDDATQALFGLTQNGAYRVITTNIHGCTDTSDAYLVSSLTTTTLARQHTPIDIYPNPATNKLHINAPVTTRLKIFSMEGRMMMEQDYHAILDLDNLLPGLYSLLVLAEDKSVLRSLTFVKVNP